MKLAVAVVVALVATAGAAFAECVMEGEGKYQVVGRFPVATAHNSCLNGYKSIYAGDKSLGNTDLYLQCTGARKRIAYVKNRQLFVQNVSVDGCPR